VEVPQLLLTHQGIEAKIPQGERILDIHHAAHSDTHNEGDNAISIGFTSHYAQMRVRFGEHMQDGIAGENIVIASTEQFWLDDLGQQIIIQDPSGERDVVLDVIKFATPCEEFSHYAANSQGKRLPAEELKATLQFLGDGRRGFLLTLNVNQEPALVKPGDLVFAVAANGSS
jgi:MOSC domain-containing protein YiiM